MKVKEFIHELKYFQMFLGEVVSNYYINEAICDFYERNIVAFSQYGNCLGQISSALVRNQHLLCDTLLHENNEGKSIPKTLNRLFTEPFSVPKETKIKVKEKASYILSILENSKEDIGNLNSFRNNVYAHFNNSLFNEEWQEEYKLKHSLDFENLLKICKQCIDTFSEILALLGEEEYLKSTIQLSSLNRFIKKLST